MSNLFTETTLWHGDCRPGLASYPAGSFTFALFSTPYPGLRDWWPPCGEATTGEAGPDYWTWFQTVLDVLIPTIVDTGAIALVINFPRTPEGFVDPWLGALPLKVWERYRLGLVESYIWDKMNPPPSGPMGLRFAIDAYEHVYVWARTPLVKRSQTRSPYAPKTVQKALSKRYRAPDVAGKLAGGHAELHEEGGIETNIIRASSSGDQNRPRATGGSFPRALAFRLIDEFTKEGDHVVDPFCGAGTTGWAAQAAGRHFTGWDLNEEDLSKAAQWMNTTILDGAKIDE